MGDQARRAALRKFLMEVRARLRPEDVGLVSIGQRRVRGLRRSRAVSTLQELGELTTDLLFDLRRPVEAACFVEADLAARKFWHVVQRAHTKYPNPPSGTFTFSAIRDAKGVLVEGGLNSTTHAEKMPDNTFFERARQVGSGRFISKGVHASSFDGAIAYFQRGNEPHSEHERESLELIAEIVYLALAART